MATGTTLLSLPCELLRVCLSYLADKDVRNFSLTCQAVRDACLPRLFSRLGAWYVAIPHRSDSRATKLAIDSNEGVSGTNATKCADFAVVNWKQLQNNVPGDLEAHILKHGCLFRSSKCFVQEHKARKAARLRLWLPAIFGLLAKHAPNLCSISLWISMETPVAYLRDIAALVPAGIETLEFQCFDGSMDDGAIVGPFLANLDEKVAHGIRQLTIKGLRRDGTRPVYKPPSFETLRLSAGGEGPGICPSKPALDFEGLPALQHVHVSVDWGSMDAARATLLTLPVSVETIVFGASGNAFSYAYRVPPPLGQATAGPSFSNPKEFTIELPLPIRFHGHRVRYLSQRLAYLSIVPITTVVYSVFQDDDDPNIIDARLLEAHFSCLHTNLSKLACVRLLQSGCGNVLTRYATLKAATGRCSAFCASLGITLDIAARVPSEDWGDPGCLFRGEPEMESALLAQDRHY